MYHALVYRSGEWVSFGLHVPAQQWTNIFQSLQRAFGEDNVAYTFWNEGDELSDVFDVRTRITHETVNANEAQKQWDAGNLDVANDDGKLNLARGILFVTQPFPV